MLQAEAARTFYDTLRERLGEGVEFLLRLRGGRQDHVHLRAGETIAHQSDLALLASLLVRREDKGAILETQALDEAGAKALAEEALALLDHATRCPDFSSVEPGRIFEEKRAEISTAAGAVFQANIAAEAWLEARAAGLDAEVLVFDLIGGRSPRRGPLTFAVGNHLGLYAHHHRRTLQVEVSLGHAEVQGRDTHLFEISRRADLATVDWVKQACAVLDEASLSQFSKASIELEIPGLTLLLDSPAVATILAPLLEAFSGSEVAAGRASLVVGDTVLPGSLHLRCDHSHELHLGMPFDEEGTPTQVVELIKEGKVAGFVYSSKSARALQTAGTGHCVDPERGEDAVRYPVLEGDDPSSVEDLQRVVKEGLLVRRLTLAGIASDGALQLRADRGALRLREGVAVGLVEPFEFQLQLREALARIKGYGHARRAHFQVVPPLLIGAEQPLFGLLMRTVGRGALGGLRGRKGARR